MHHSLHALLARGAADEALRLAADLLAQRRLRDGLSAHLVVGESVPALRAHCWGVAGDVYAELGEVDRALGAYAAATQAGAPTEWARARTDRLLRLLPETYVSGGGREASAFASQEGVVVVRPQFVAFLPTSAEVTVLGILGRLAVSGATGAAWARLPRGASRESVVTALRQRTAVEIDELVPELTHGGVFWPRGDAWLEQTKLPLGLRLAFTDGHTRLHVVPAKSALASPAFARLAAFWPPPVGPASRPRGTA